MAGMQLLGAATFLDALDDLKDTYSGGDGYVMGTNAPYAPPQEFGTYAQSGTPHLRPSIDATKREMGRLAAQADDLDQFLRLTALNLEAETKERAPVLTGHLRASYETQEL